MKRKRLLGGAILALVALSGLGYIAVSAISDPVPVDHGPGSLDVSLGLKCPPSDTRAISGVLDYEVGGPGSYSTPEVALAHFLTRTYPNADVKLFVKIGQDLEAAVFKAGDEARAVAEAADGKWYLTQWAVCESTAKKWGSQ